MGRAICVLGSREFWVGAQGLNVKPGPEAEPCGASPADCGTDWQKWGKRPAVPDGWKLACTPAGLVLS